MRVNLPGQLDLPDTEERTSDRAKRLALAPMRARQVQQPCDHGLFSDEALQVDLEDLIQQRGRAPLTRETIR